MTKPNDGGLAYPSGELKFDDGDCKTAIHTGLNKREAFAMAAMQGLCANQTIMQNSKGANDIVWMAMMLSESLLAELNKE